MAFENQTFVYTAHGNCGMSLTPFTVTLNNGVNIIFAPGQLTASSDLQPAQVKTCTWMGQVTPVSIASTSGGNFEAVNSTTFGHATVTIKDTRSTDHGDVERRDRERGRRHGDDLGQRRPCAPQGSNLVLTLSNGATTTILDGQTTGTSTPFAVQGDDPYVDHEKAVHASRSPARPARITRR